MADGNTEPSESASSSTPPSLRYSPGVRNRSPAVSPCSAAPTGTDCAAVASCPTPRQGGTSWQAPSPPGSPDRACRAACGAAPVPVGDPPPRVAGSPTPARHTSAPTARRLPPSPGGSSPALGTSMQRSAEFGNGRLGSRLWRVRIEAALDAVNHGRRLAPGPRPAPPCP